MWAYIQQAGIIGYILVGISVVSAGVVIERMRFWLQQGRKPDANTRSRIFEFLKLEKLDEVKALVKENGSMEDRALYRLFQYKKVDNDSPLEIILNREHKAAHQWLLILDVNGSIAPMVGILGTVIGIITAFKGMSGNTPDTNVMISGISVSMLTTAIGLIVALSSIIPYNFLASKAHRRLSDLGDLLQECWLCLPLEKSEASVETKIAEIAISDRIQKDIEP